MLVQIVIHDRLTPEQGKSATDDQKRAVGDGVAHRADAHHDEEEADQPTRKERDQ
jgi:hypothetical protein